MKKAYISPVTTLLMSLSLALGILVSDLSGYRLLTTAHAQKDTCARQPGEDTAVSDSVNIVNGRILSGLTVRNVVVNGNVLEHAVIAGGVQVINAAVVNSISVINAGGGADTSRDGVIVGVDSPCTNGVIVGVDNPQATGVIVGVDAASINGVIVGVDNSTNGVIVGVDSADLIGVTAATSGTAVGGTLTGDGVTVSDGVITGQNLLLSGTTIDGGTIAGAIASVRVPRAN